MKIYQLWIRQNSSVYLPERSKIKTEVRKGQGKRKDHQPTSSNQDHDHQTVSNVFPFLDPPVFVAKPPTD